MLAPEPTGVPPQLPEYHCQLAAVPRAPPLTDKVVFPPEQMVLVVVLMEAGAVELLFTLISTFTQEVVLHEPTAFT